ncbi:spermidine synthase [Rothia sp. ZJ1223]|uniref:spermidine synthase n=1 Tax=Rothia sp. ZJ1223 TaxID=2811098 RepID=UPI00195E3551|nr:fused MFS/spermidine synthase [Rothia sp. ZJ1223]MBM7051547.1 fused MFS/spermidine synthase [Rothia sp. ZJ1223]
MSSKNKSVQLSVSGLSAQILPDGMSPDGYVLEIGGAEQSHLDLGDPSFIFYEYLRRIGNVIDLLAAPGDPLRVAHLGAGALTLVRYVQVTRPGSPQIAVDIERELPSLVLDALPLPAGSRCQVLVEDARAALPALTPALGAAPQAIILDIFSGWSAPEHLADEGFYREMKEVLDAEGALIINVGDDAGLSFFTAQARSLLNVFEHLWCLAPTVMLDGKHAGNLVLVASHHELTADLKTALIGQGPHPASALDTWQVQELIDELS